MAIAQVAGLIAGAWLVWLYAVWPRLGGQSVAGMAAEALFYVAIAWICGAVITFCIYLVVSLADMPDVVRFSMRSAAPAMWFAPACILLSVPAVAAFAVSLVIVVNATRLLVGQWVSIESPVDRVEPAQAGDCILFGSLVSFAAQAGVVAMLWRHPLLAAAFLSTSVAILTSLSIVTGAYRPAKPPTLPPSVLSVAATFVLAAALAFSGMAVRRGVGTASEGIPNPAAEQGGHPATTLVTRTVAPPEEGTDLGDGFPGVILLPELNRHTTLFVPVTTPRLSGTVPTRPVGIPFSGEYWMFKPPRTRPPLRSIVRRGKPSEVAFHTTDGAAMEMEAHQRLDPPVDVTCCSKIELVTFSADRYPGTVSLELILVASETAGGRWESLGIVAVGSGGAREQTLSFRVPPAMALHKFDEFKVVFHRDMARADKSARIAIERFVLAP